MLLLSQCPSLCCSTLLVVNGSVQFLDATGLLMPVYLVCSYSYACVHVVITVVALMHLLMSMLWLAMLLQLLLLLLDGPVYSPSLSLA
jgi:hypothetical protein